MDQCVDLVGQVPRLLGLVFRPIQNGLAQFYALAMALGLAVFLVALAFAYDYYRTNGKLPLEGGATLGKNLELLPARRVAKDTPDLFGGWIIHKEGFRAPKILEVARLQAWTLKPAIQKD